MLEEDQTHHARRVLRLRVGDAVELFDGHGRLARGRIAFWEGRRAVCEVDRAARHAPPGPTLTVASAAPKGPRMEALADHLSQLGVDHWILLRTGRSVVAPRSGRLEKLRRTAMESCKQSGRVWGMTVDGPRDVASVMAQAEGRKLIAHPQAPTPNGTRGMKGPSFKQEEPVLVMVGPEGGWTPWELAQAKEAGFGPWRLGPHVLRIETAAIAAAALVRYEAEEEVEADAATPRPPAHDE